ncbi:MAG TPA: cyclic nucleotide-binding domain-containing protein [Actinomycetota bacterium]|nr:cyclic nucleotide-binding domain-containing protein [Actinomycetota bacterium]
MRRRSRSRSLVAVKTVFANFELRRVELAYLLFYIARWGMRVAILVFAYQRGGVEEASLVAVIIEVPAAIVAPMASVIGDEIRRDRALLAGYVAQAAALAGTAGAIYADAPSTVVYGLTAVAAGCMTLTRPVQSALFPMLANSPDQLVAANVVAGSISAAMAFVGPVTSGVLLGLGGAELALAVYGGLLLISAPLVVRLQPHPPQARIGGHPLHEAAAGFRAVARDPDQRLVVGLLLGQSFVRGSVDVLVVVIALELFGLPSSAVGFLASALGAGGLLGAVWGLRLVGRPYLAAAIALGLLVYGFGISAVSLAVVVAMAFATLVGAGSGHALADMAGRTLLQRIVPDPILARVFGVLEGLHQAGVAGGSAVAPLLVYVFGIRGGILVAGLLLPTAILILRGRIRSLDDRAMPIPERELEILRSVDMFASLPAPELEGLAARLAVVKAAPGTAIVTEGETGHHLYVIEDGEVEVVRDGQPMAMLGPGDYFGEIALLRHVPRTATVVAKSHSTLLSLEREAFLEEVTGHPVVRKTVDLTVQERMRNE